MHIDIYKQEDGSYIIDDHYYADAKEVLVEIIHCCGCGSPSTAIKYVMEILSIINKGTPDDRTDQESWGLSRKELEAFFKSEGEYYFVLYNLDHLGFLEHGSSIGGSWITDKGKKFLEDATEFLSPAEDEY